MKAIRSIEIKSAVLYGAVLAAFWTLAFGIYAWLMGWLFAGQAWFIDVNLANWTSYTIQTFLSVILRMLLHGLGGALAGLVVGLVYNAVAGMMGGLKINVE